MADLTDDELSVLLIAREGAWLAPIGRWEKPIIDMTDRGLMSCRDSVNYTITDLGRQAAMEEEQKRDHVLVASLAGVASTIPGAPMVAKAIPPVITASHDVTDAEKKALVVAGLDELADRLEHGYDLDIGQLTKRLRRFAELLRCI